MGTVGGSSSSQRPLRGLQMLPLRGRNHSAVPGEELPDDPRPLTAELLGSRRRVAEVPFRSSVARLRSGSAWVLRAPGRGSRSGRSRGGRRWARRSLGPPRARCRRGSGRRCGRAASIFTSASRATAAAWPTVEWPVSSARWASSSEKLASWTRSSAPRAASTVAGAGAGVAGDHDRPPGAALPDDLLRRDRPGGALDRLTALQGGEGRPFGDAEGLRRLEVEAAGPLVLDQRVAAGTDAVLDLEGADLGVLERHHVAGLEFDQVEPEADPPDQPAERLEQVLAGRAGRRP